MSQEREQTIALIRTLSGSVGAFDQLEASLTSLRREQLSERLLICGIIPEMFAHDSSEEKLWAKYCDILLAATLNYLNIPARVIRTRGDSADVLGETKGYSIVGDAKAFRLSRTAKNQKDFKIGALDDWRRGSTFACLVAPLYQYPTGSSQIYQQAEARNVTLLSYIHLKFLLDFAPHGSLLHLWQTAGNLTPERGAQRYWNAIDQAVLDVTGESAQLLAEYKQAETDSAKEIGREGIAYWQSLIESYHQLTQEEAINRLIKAEKIEAKIRTIRQAIAEVINEQ